MRDQLLNRFMKMSTTTKKPKKEISINERLDQLIDSKKNENSALIKIVKSLEKEKDQMKKTVK